MNVGHDSPGWSSAGATEPEAASTNAPLHQGYVGLIHSQGSRRRRGSSSVCLMRLQLRLMSQCSGSVENLKRVSLILDDEDQPEELGLTGLTATDKQSGESRHQGLLD